MDKEKMIKEQIETLIEIRKTVDMNRSEFSRFMNIPVRTLEEWEAGRRKMPDYVLRLLAYHIKMEQGIKDGKIIVEEKTANKRNKRTQDSLDSKQVLSVIEKYSTALDLLDAYDHQSMTRPKGNTATYVLSYEECMEVISSMRFGAESDIFGKEKDGSFKGSIGNIYQSFAGQDVYPTLEEKAAHLLYFVTKNHSFWDGNKRIAATMFLYFLDKNDALFIDGRKVIDDYTLVALTIMIAESKPDEMEMMITVVMNCIDLGRV